MAPSNSGSDADIEARTDSEQAAVLRPPVFAIKAARGQAPYAVLGHRTARTVEARGGSVPSDAATAPPAAHSAKVKGGRVVESSTEGKQATGGAGSEGEGGEGVREVKLPPIATDLSLDQRPAEAMRLAQEAFSQTGYWVSFYRAILSVDGVAHKLFSNREEMAFFEETGEFAEIQKMLTALRTSDHEKIDAVEPQTMITIRMPRSLRAVLVEEAKRQGVSVNKLCISKLLLPIDPEFVPREKGKVRGRKPGQASQAKPAKAKSAKAKSSKAKARG